MYSDKPQFFEAIRSSQSEQLLEDWFAEDSLPYVFKNETIRDEFYAPIIRDWGNTEKLLIGGTGAWRYSLNPKKEFREFSSLSDIDVINISNSHFDDTWSKLRDYHRKNWYGIAKHQRDNLMRCGQNVYCGFSSPKWIPNNSDDFRFLFVSRLETYSSKEIGYRTVNMMFFRSLIEVKDYYRRGIELAKHKLQ